MTQHPVIHPWRGLKVLVALLICAAVWSGELLRAQDDSNPPASGNGVYVAPAPPSDTTGPILDTPEAAPDATGADPSFQTFYDALGSQGTWLQSPDYGYVWQPNIDDPNWAPYTVGHWAYSDQGWAWVSDEPWGWATYHYGRWVNLDGVGWCWVPGYTWAPAWVSWRYGDDYCGWAPLPPDSFIGVDYDDGVTQFQAGYYIGGDCDTFYGIGAGWYCFLPIKYLCKSSYHGCYLDRRNNDQVINHTNNVTNIRVNRANQVAGGGGPGFHRTPGQGRVTAGGPTLEQVNAVVPTPMATVNLVRSNRVSGGVVSNNTLFFYAPQLNPAATQGARPAKVAGTLGRAPINRGTDITQPLAVNPRLTPAAATEDQVRQARIAQNHAPAAAKVITAVSTVTPVLHAPLTSLAPTPQPPIEHRSYRAPVSPPSSVTPGAASSVATQPGPNRSEAVPPANTEAAPASSTTNPQQHRLPPGATYESPTQAQRSVVPESPRQWQSPPSPTTLPPSPIPPNSPAAGGGTPAPQQRH